MLLPAQLQKRKSDTHKGDYGHVLVIGGSCGLTGAVCLCAQAALRSGCGLVTVGVPSSLNNIFEVKLTEVMSLPLKETSQRTLSLSAFKIIKQFSLKVDVIIAGCGASCNVSTKKLIVKILREINKPLVVDADGINAFVGDLETLRRRVFRDVIFTPHMGEFSRLINKSIDYIRKKRKRLAKEFALRYNLILVLKGCRTIITDGKRFIENTTGNPGMATAGSGDVLSGIISGLMAQGLSGFESAKLGVYLHGLAGDLAVRDITQVSLVASDIIKYLPLAVKKSKRPGSSIGRAGVL